MNHEWRAYRDPAFGGIGIYLTYRIGGKRFLGSQVQITDIEVDEGRIYDPSFRLSDAEAQQLFQTLWDTGLRPNNGEGASGHIDALKYHLEDMRKLVFKEPIGG